MNDFLNYFAICHYEKYGHAKLIKLNDVLKSCKTVDHYYMSRNYARIAFYNIKSYINHNGSSIRSYFYLLNIIRDIESDFQDKAIALEVEYKEIF